MKKSPFQRYFHIPLTASLFCGVMMTPLSGYAQDNTSFTPEQHKEIITTVRQALKNDPSILEDAIIAAQQNRTKQRAESASKTLAEKKNVLTNVLPTDGFIGNPNAKNTIVEFFDPRCPYCKKILPELVQLTKDDKNVRVIFKVVPILGENSVLQSRAIVAATRQNGYVGMMKAIMDSKEKATAANQNGYVGMMKAIMDSKEEITEDVIKKIAKQQKLDADRLIQDMKAASVTKALENNVQLLRDLGIDGTPALVINDTKIIPGAVSYETLKTILQKEGK